MSLASCNALAGSFPSLNPLYSSSMSCGVEALLTSQSPPMTLCAPALRKGRHFAKTGHTVGLSNSRGPASLAALVKSIGPKACAITIAESAKFGEVIVLAVPCVAKCR